MADTAAVRRWVGVASALVGTVLALSAGSVLPAAAASAEQLLQRMRQAADGVQDARSRVETEWVQPDGRRWRSAVLVWMVRQPAVVRVQVLEPVTLADQIYVVDGERRTLAVYLPITHQIVVQPLERELDRWGVLAGVAPALWLQPDPSWLQQASARVSVEGQGSSARYVLEADLPRTAGGAPADGSARRPAGVLPAGASRAATPLAQASPAIQQLWDRLARLQLWVNSSSWLAERLVGYDAAGKPVVTVVIGDLQLNAGLRADDLRHLPDDAEVIEG